MRRWRTLSMSTISNGEIQTSVRSASETNFPASSGDQPNTASDITEPSNPRASSRPT